MAYSLRMNPPRFVNHITGKSYPFDPTGKHGPANKAAAKAKMEEEERAITQAAEQRHGRPLSLRELRDGVKEPDLRTIRERVLEEVTFAQKPDNSASPFAKRIADLESKLAFTTRKQDRASIERKLSALRLASEAHDRKIAEQRAFEEMLNSAETQQHIKHAETQLEILLHRPDATDSEIASARQRLKAIRETGDVSAYRTAWEAYKAQDKEAALAKESELNRRLAEVRAEYEIETGIGEASNGLLEPELLDPTAQ